MLDLIHLTWGSELAFWREGRRAEPEFSYTKILWSIIRGVGKGEQVSVNQLLCDTFFTSTKIYKDQFSRPYWTLPWSYLQLEQRLLCFFRLRNLWSSESPVGQTFITVVAYTLQRKSSFSYTKNSPKFLSSIQFVGNVKSGFAIVVKKGQVLILVILKSRTNRLTPALKP